MVCVLVSVACCCNASMRMGMHMGCICHCLTRFSDVTCANVKKSWLYIPLPNVFFLLVDVLGDIGPHATYAMHVVHDGKSKFQDHRVHFITPSVFASVNLPWPSVVRRVRNFCDVPETAAALRPQSSRPRRSAAFFAENQKNGVPAQIAAAETGKTRQKGHKMIS